MQFRKWLENLVSLSSDSFLHFTSLDRAKQILASGKLLMNPPYAKFGTDSVDAVSVNYGVFQPSVQLTHIKGDPIAIHFKTNVIPYVAYPEEVKWNCDVPLIGASIISKKEAQKLLKSHSEEFELQYK